MIVSCVKKLPLNTLTATTARPLSLIAPTGVNVAALVPRTGIVPVPSHAPPMTSDRVAPSWTASGNA